MRQGCAPGILAGSETPKRTVYGSEVGTMVKSHDMVLYCVVDFLRRWGKICCLPEATALFMLKPLLCRGASLYSRPLNAWALISDSMPQGCATCKGPFVATASDVSKFFSSLAAFNGSVLPTENLVGNCKDVLPLARACTLSN